METEKSTRPVEKDFDYARLFSGRVGRSHFAFYVLMCFPIVSILRILGETFPETWVAVSAALVVVPIALVSVGMQIRRLHDLNISGQWIIIPFFINYLLFFTSRSLQENVMGRTLMLSDDMLLVINLIAWLISVIVLLFLIFKRGDKTPNRFGVVQASNVDFGDAILNQK